MVQVMQALTDLEPHNAPQNYLIPFNKSGTLLII
jgi:hypothetical protein